MAFIKLLSDVQWWCKKV